MSQPSQILRSSLVRACGVVICTILLAHWLVESAQAQEPPRKTTQGEASGPVLVEVGGWEIFARRAVVEAAWVRLDEVYARTGSWVLTANHVEFAFRGPGTSSLAWLLARGDVKVAGPDELFVTAPQMVSMDPSRELVFVEAGDAPSVSETDWRLLARRIVVELATGRVSVEQVVTE